MRLLLALLTLLLLPAPAQAGPWPREAQGWFLATSMGQERVGAARQTFGDLYAEYGATGRLTLAAQLRHIPGGWRGDLIARFHPQPAGFALPFGLSAGTRFQPGRADRALLLFGAHLGQGFDTRAGNLWARLDMQMHTRPAQLTNPVELSLSGQLGFRSARGLLGMVSLTGKRRNGVSRLELAPAIGHEIGRAHTLVLGLTAASHSRSVTSAQLALWSRF